MGANRSQSGGPRCGNCGYNLTGAPSNRCPECGLLFIEAGVIVARREPGRSLQRRLLLVIGLLCLPIVASLMLSLYLRAQAEAARAAAAARQAQARAIQMRALNASLGSLGDSMAASQPASLPARHSEQ